jgi:CO/xanthine dehydrogenase FAD-binding subunit
MLSFNFKYYRPDTIEEALSIYREYDSKDKKVLYYGGGTEIISFGRKNDIYADAVIDIKGIRECSALYISDSEFYAGAAVTLTELSESMYLPLLSKAAGFAADHTVRNKITLGGNICGRIIYREAVLPFLVSNSFAVIAGNNGLKRIPINDVFNKTLRLQRGELLVRLETDKEYLNLPYAAVKKTKISKIDYPIVSVSALKKDDQVQIALSGALSYPFRSYEVERALNDKNMPIEERVENAVSTFKDEIMSGITASSGYREFVVKNTLIDIVAELEGI